MTDDPTDTPEPTAEEWQLAHRLCVCCNPGPPPQEDCPVCAEAASHISRYRVRVQRETAGRAAEVCREYEAELEETRETQRARGDESAEDRASYIGFVIVGADECARRVSELSTDAPESLEMLLERARALGQQLGLEEINPGEWEACINVEQRGDRPGYLHTATGPTPHAALRALLQEDDDGE